jgi:hypothetical protein
MEHYAQVAREEKPSYIAKTCLKWLSLKRFLGGCGHSARSVKALFIKMSCAPVEIVQYFTGE